MAGIYIHVPFCRHKCSYCDFVSFPDKIEYAEAYMACLYKELKMRGEELKDSTPYISAAERPRTFRPNSSSAR